MKCENYQDITHDCQFRSFAKKPKLLPIQAFDTETEKGKAFLLGCSDGAYSWSKTLDSHLEFLTCSRYQKTLNVFWHLEYDFYAIFKRFSRKELQELYYFNVLEHGEYTIRLIPRKFFSIKHKNITVSYFDIFQFYRMSLDNAAKRYLGEEKKSIDVTKFGNAAYRKKHQERIIEYCLRDCTLTQQLGEHLKSMLALIDVPLIKPYSAASLSVRWFNRKYRIPVSYWDERDKLAYQQYRGGRFEVFQRGYFPKLYSYDIISAYPSVITELRDIQKGEWYYANRLLEDYTYAFLKVRISTKENIIQPLGAKYEGVSVFAHLSKQERVITGEEYEFMLAHDLADIEVITGCFFYSVGEHYPFKDMQMLYEYRKSLKDDDNPLHMGIKLLQNSLYGKFLELKPVLQACPYGVLSNDAFAVTGTTHNNYYRKEWHTGNWFNPVYAALITSKIRLRLLEAALPYQKHIISFQTDGLLSTKKCVSTDDKLGGWEYKGKYEGVIIGSGVYTLQNNEDFVTRFRGFMSTRKLNLFDLLRSNPRKRIIAMDKTRVVKLGEWLLHPKVMRQDGLNEFVNVRRCLDINFDKKRLWDKPFISATHCLTEKIISHPLTQ